MMMLALGRGPSTEYRMAGVDFFSVFAWVAPFISVISTQVWHEVGMSSSIKPAEVFLESTSGQKLEGDWGALGGMALPPSRAPSRTPSGLRAWNIGLGWVSVQRAPGSPRGPVRHTRARKAADTPPFYR